MYLLCLCAEVSPSLYSRQFGGRAGGEEAARADCQTDRSEANREARSGNDGAYVPECDKNGKGATQEKIWYKDKDIRIRI